MLASMSLRDMKHRCTEPDILPRKPKVGIQLTEDSC
jgi:hypothetical protein